MPNSAPQPPLTIPRAALFLDRDGTLIRHIPYLHDPEQVAVLPGVAAALKRAQAQGIRLFLHTNQSGVGRGYFTMADVEAVHDRLFQLLDLPRPFDALKIAPDHPDQPGPWRKPSPRFVQEMIARHDLSPAHCYFIGDSRSDVKTALNAGIRGLAIRGGAGDAEDPGWPEFLSTANVPQFTAAADAIEAAVTQISG